MTAGPTDRAPARPESPPLARTEDEVQLFLELRPCERCGGTDADWETVLVELDDGLARVYTGTCQRCGTAREFLFRLPAQPAHPSADEPVFFGGPDPSELLDAGEWLWLAELAAGPAPVEDGDADWHGVVVAAAAMGEILKFIPAGAEEVPDTAFWSTRGRRVRAEDPGRFHRDVLEIVRDGFRRQVPVPEPDDWDTTRGRIVTEANRLLAAVYEARDAGRWQEIEEHASRIDPLRGRYAALLPLRTVSRCPYTGTLIEWPLDDVDLDGWFWRYDAPARRLPSLPDTWLAMTGAMRLGEPVARAPFECRPGPGAPFVVPSLLRDAQTTAVLVEVPVGPHTGWAVSYFGTRPAVEHLPNLWGTGSYPLPDGAGGWATWGRAPDRPDDRDFALEPWLAAGRLLWVAPDDAGFELRRGADGCPYLGITGPREPALIRDGAVERPAPEVR